MKNRVMKTTKVVAAMAIASVIMGTASLTAKAEDEVDN